MATEIKLRRDISTNWTSTNPILAQGEPGYETDTGKLKLGDGTTAWASLAYQAAANIVDGTIVNADINASAGIVDTKLATIATAGKVSNSATTATDANTASAIVARDASGNFTAGTITAAVTGAASSNVLKAGDTMTGALVVPLASAATPSLTFTGDLNTGIYSPGADQVAVATNGVQRLTVDTAATTSTLPVVHPLGAVGTPSITFTGDLNTGIWSPAADTVAASTAGSERLRITSTGLVGIGTSSPTYLLQAAGTIASVNSFGNFAALQAAGGTGFRWTLSNDGTFRLQRTLDGFASASIPIFINSSDRVGIGTTSPAGILDLVTGTNRGYFDDSAGSLFRLNAVNAANSAYAPLTINGSVLTFQTAAAECARIDSSGRLLVGTSSAPSVLSTQAKFNLAVGDEGAATIGRWSSNQYGPAFALAKSRSTSIGTSTIVQNGDSLGSIYFLGADGVDLDSSAALIEAFVDGTPGSNDMPGRLVFSTTADGAASPTEAMRINNGQELLVGYTSDNGAYKLQVNSQIFATSATVATSDGRYKENVSTLGDCVDLVKALRPVSFTWKPQQDITRTDEDGNEVLVREGHNFPDGTQVGFIAQEVQEVLSEKPWLTSVIKQNVRPAVNDSNGNELAPEEEFFGIAEGNLIAVLTSALQEAIGRIETLEAAVTALQQS